MTYPAWQHFMDPNAVLSANHGKIYLVNALQGRIFASLDGELLHRLDCQLAGAPDAHAFNNFGGNSLWPAPEGGDYAFNYAAGSDVWLVQEGINQTCPTLLSDGQDGSLHAVKEITLVNRRGIAMPMRFSRRVTALQLDPLIQRYDVHATGYAEQDSWTLHHPISVEEGVIAAWSLEQFAGSENILAFGRVAGNPRHAMHTDFYGDPQSRLTFAEHQFTFQLGGSDRLQIGLDAAESPEWIGAWIAERDLLILRHTERQPGTYINIADNAQPGGVFGARDQYSIFNGAKLNFFELETIAPIQLNAAGRVSGSELTSQTWFFRGRPEQLRKLLRQEFHFDTACGQAE